jgi:hypothetical protein
MIIGITLREHYYLWDWNVVIVRRIDNRTYVYSYKQDFKNKNFDSL